MRRTAKGQFFLNWKTEKREWKRENKKKAKQQLKHR